MTAQTLHPPVVPDDPTRPLTETQYDALERFGVSRTDLEGEDHDE